MRVTMKQINSPFLFFNLESPNPVCFEYSAAYSGARASSVRSLQWAAHPAFQIGALPVGPSGADSRADGIYNSICMRCSLCLVVLQLYYAQKQLPPEDCPHSYC